MIGGMAEPEPSPTRRRRRRGTSTPGPAEQRTSPEKQHNPEDEHPAGTAPAPRSKPRSRPRGESTDRGLRGLVGAGPSQLGVSGALRGRDVNRPSDDDLAEAERDVVLVRRNWKPPPA